MFVNTKPREVEEKKVGRLIIYRICMRNAAFNPLSMANSAFPRNFNGKKLKNVAERTRNNADVIRLSLLL